MRGRIVLVGAIAALALWFLGAIFDLNGEQWSWWRTGSLECAFLVLVLTVLCAIRARGPLRRPRLRYVGGIVLGACAVGASTAVEASRYSDPYAGPLLWPHVLAAVAAAGVAVVALSVAATVLDTGSGR